MGRIDRLLIENFKSYGNTQIIGPFTKFTAIIGPNGSGKSNLMDAISFVLGVQSRHLRSNQLKDLLFRSPDYNENENKNKILNDSSNSLKPAKVTLFYIVSTNNEIEGLKEGDEYSFTRTVSITGQSSYLLNDQLVTYNDYENQLKQIGIIVKARNFLIFQGDVENLASKKPEDLTRLFEQISSSEDLKEEYDTLLTEKNEAEEQVILAYQTSKGIKVEKKLADEEKEEAERFQNKTNDLKKLKVEYFLWQLNDVVSALKEKKSDILKIMGDVEKEKLKQEKLCSEYSTKKKELLKESQHFSTTEKSYYNNIKAIKNDIAPKLLRYKEEIDYNENLINNLNHELKKSRKKLARRDNLVLDLQTEIRKLEEEQASLDEKFHQKDTKEHLSMTVEQQKEYNLLKESCKIKTSTLNGRLMSIFDEKNLEGLRHENLLQQQNDMLEEIKSLSRKKDMASKRLREIEVFVSETTTSIAEVSSSIANYNEENSKRKDKIQKLHKEHESTVLKLRELREYRYQNINNDKRNEILESLQRMFPGVRGRLFDLCKPVERRYNLSVTVACGKYMEAIVVDSYKSVIEIINYLQEKKLISFTFIPLDKIKIKKYSENIQKTRNRLQHIKSTDKLVIDIMECEQDILPALIYAVNDAVVCENIDAARKLCFEISSANKIKAVTLDGMIIGKNGAMTGGKTSSSTNQTKCARWDEKTVNNLKVKRDKLSYELRDLEQNDRSYNNESFLKLETNLKNLKQRLCYLNSDSINTQKTISQYDDRINNNKKEITNTIQPELENFKSKIQLKEDSIRLLQDQIYEIEDKIFEDFCLALGFENIRQYERETLKKEQKIAIEKSKIQEHLAKLKAQLDYEISHKYEAEIGDKLKRIDEVQSLLLKIKKKVKKRQDEKKKLTKENHNIESIIDRQKSKIKGIEASLKKLKSDRSVHEIKLDELANIINKHQSAYERLKHKKNEILNKASIEQVDLPLLGKNYCEEDSDNNNQMNDEVPAGSALTFLAYGSDELNDIRLDFSILSSTKRFIRSKVSRLRNNNEEYLEVKEKYEKLINELNDYLAKAKPNLRIFDKLSSLEQDLDQSENKLLSYKKNFLLINKKFESIKTARTKRFMSAFKAVADNIDEIYKNLTKSIKHPLGGTAHFSLVNNEEPFLYGINYNVMPPMKRYREMDQLSGGEKTVAALALLFSLHKYQKTPFFIMDEIDAALDNVNVGKITNFILQNCVENFQIIIISLKDFFYEKAETLVGVCKDIKTQQSKTLTLDLRKFT